MPKHSIGVKPKKKFNGHPSEKLDKPVRFHPTDARYEEDQKSCGDPFYPGRHCSGNQYFKNNYGYNEFGPYPRYGMSYYGASTRNTINERRARYMKYQRLQVANKAHALLNPYGRHRGLYGDGVWPSL